MNIKKIQYMLPPKDLVHDCLDVFVYLDENFSNHQSGYLVEITTPECISGIIEKSKSGFLPPECPFIIVSNINVHCMYVYIFSWESDM